jgi:hypothetical protein
MFWPTPAATKSRLRVGVEDTWFALPVIPFEDRPEPAFLPSEPRQERTDARRVPGKGWPAKQKTIVDHVKRTTSVEWRGESNYEIEGRKYYSFEEMLHLTHHEDPANSSFQGSAGHRIELEGRTLELKTELGVISDEKNFNVEFTRRIFENGFLIREKTWREVIPRLFQ